MAQPRFTASGDYAGEHWLGTFALLHSVFHEWIGIVRDMWSAPWHAKLGYLLREPGWTHDDSRDTSDSIRAKWLESQPE